MSHETMSIDLSAEGFCELSQLEMTRVNGGGFWSIIGGFLARALTWEVLFAAALWDFITNPGGTMAEIHEGWAEYI